MSSLVYDTGALLAAERGDRGVWSLHDEALGVGIIPVVPVVVVTAIARAGLVVTSDPGDLSRLAAALGASVQLHRV